MVTILLAVVSIIAFRFRSRAALELQASRASTSTGRSAPATPW
jgi:hypothetical protein